MYPAQEAKQRHRCTWSRVHRFWVETARFYTPRNRPVGVQYMLRLRQKPAESHVNQCFASGLAADVSQSDERSIRPLELFQ